MNKNQTIDKLSVFTATGGSFYAMVWSEGKPQAELLLDAAKVSCDPERCSRRHSWDSN